jgi:hypothetical protein
MANYYKEFVGLFEVEFRTVPLNARTFNYCHKYFLIIGKIFFFNSGSFIANAKLASI